MYDIDYSQDYDVFFLISDMEVKGETKHKPYPGTRFADLRQSGQMHDTGGSYPVAKEQPYVCHPFLFGDRY